MMDEVARLIQAGDEETLLSWLLSGKLSAVPEREKAEWPFFAVRLGRAGMLRLLCERCHGMPLDPDAQGRTLLHAAACTGDRPTLRFLLNTLGMDPLAGDCRGQTPLDLAAQNPDALRALEELSGLRRGECYRNPVLRGFRPDPSILRVGEDYYLINSSFVMLPALPISHSRDLVHWEEAGHVFTDADTARLTGLPGGFGYWAPDISYFQGRFWVVATLRRNTAPFRLQMITSASSPAGPWTPPRFLEVDGIDPSLFTDSDGTRYLVVNPGVQIARISPEGELLEAPEMIWYGWNKRKSEGPHLLKKDGWYYILQAEGGTGSGHMVSCSRSRALKGPYAPCPFNPILGAKSEKAFIGRSGHGKAVQLPDGRWALVYLCGRSVEGKTLMGRETAIDPLTWTADGWPMVNGLNGPSCLQKSFLPPWRAEEREAWLCPRLDTARFAQTLPGGAIQLTGGGALSQLSSAHLLLHRQREENISQQVRVDISGMAPGGRAGLAGYYDENSHYLFSLRKTAEGAQVLLTEQIGEESRETALGELRGAQALLKLSGSGLSRAAEIPALERTIPFRVEYLTDEGLKMGKRFTGALLGLGAVGEGKALFQEYSEEMRNEG